MVEQRYLAIGGSNASFNDWLRGENARPDPSAACRSRPLREVVRSAYRRRTRRAGRHARVSKRTPTILCRSARRPRRVRRDNHAS
jgi:hypothetical protein